MPATSTQQLHARRRNGANGTNGNEEFIRVRLRPLEIPPIKDAIVIGTDAAIGGEAMARILQLMSHEKFDRFRIRDDVIAEFVVRHSITRKLGRERLTDFILSRVKPVMGNNELLLLDIEVELQIEASL